jgi:DNA-binding NarL/FixJ family response regulator
MQASSLRILIADDHDLMRRGIKALLESYSGWSICAEAQTGHEAVKRAEESRPDIAVLDITMPELNGIDAARKIQKQSPNTRILILSMHFSEQLTAELLAAGIHGYIVKSDSERDLARAVEALAAGKFFFTPLATKEMLAAFKSESSREPEPADARLTTREREILHLLSEGKSNKEIATILGISTKTAETHRSNIMSKLDLHSISLLVRYAVRNRIVEP